MKPYYILGLIIITFGTIFQLKLYSEPNSTLPENLGPKVNSVYDEFMPVLTADGKTLYFCRRRHPMNLGKEKKDDIWYSTLQDNGEWSEPVNMGSPLNNEFANAVESVSSDRNTLLLAGDYFINGDLTPGFYQSHRVGSSWSEPEPIKIKSFYNKSRFFSFCFSNDKNTLLLALKRDDTYGDLDIYASHRLSDNEWSEPENLGHVINTDSADTSPFLAADGITLYFSSKGHESYGDYDVFVSKRLDDSWKKWSEPINLGTTINTAGGEANYIISASGDHAYFASSLNTHGGWDIFRVPLPKAAKPKPVVLIKGNVFIKDVRGKGTFKVSKDPIAAKIYYQSLPDAKEIGNATTNPKDGSYTIIAPAGYVYKFIVSAKGFLPYYEEISLDTVTNYIEIRKDFELSLSDSLLGLLRNLMISNVNRSTPIPDFLEILPEYILQEEIFDKVVINFNFNEYLLQTNDKKEQPKLDFIANILGAYPNFKLIMAGNTDSIGNAEYNKVLSEKRAKSVSDYLLAKGISKKRFELKAVGMSNPIESNLTEEGRARNRRVAFYIAKR
jgi:outer membrane protein OmpA-like peptidoglycan-associated protein